MTTARSDLLSYPTSSDYIAAVQRPGEAFRDPALQRARFAADPPFHIPTPASGTAAVVFRAEVEGRDQALRFFTRARMSTAHRYAAVGRHLADHRLDGDAAAARWVDDAITVRDRSWPMIRMDWVDGRTLDAYAGELATAGERAALAALAAQWRDLIARMQRAGFAHGDLQHGNVLFDQSLRLRLVDLDGAWIAELAGEPAPTETGHRNYQRADRQWGPWMDTFPALVIYLSLVALAERPQLWAERHDGDNLLFTAGDFAPPFRSAGWAALGGSTGPHTAYAAARLRECCQPGWRTSGPLELLLTGAPPLSVTRPAPSGSADWWVQAAARQAGSAERPLPRPTPAGAAERPPAQPADPAPLQPAWPFAPRTTVPPPAGGSGRSGISVLIAAAIGLLVAFVIATASDGEAPAAAVLVGLVVAGVLTPILLARHRR